MKKLLLSVIILVVVAYVFLVIWKNREAAEPVVMEKPVALNPREHGPEQQEEPVKYPVPVPESEPVPDTDTAPDREPLPELDESDAVILGAMAPLENGFRWRDFFPFESLVRHFVVTVDNLTSAKLPRRYRLIQAPGGNFLVRKDEGETLYIDPANDDRYGAYVRIAESVDLNGLVKVYRRFYPLFQRAYEELGYPDRYFNDRLVEVIDHLLDAPEIRGPIALKQPKVFYTFADPALEARSAGHKLMLRMGAYNCARIKARLKILRELLTSF